MNALEQAIGFGIVSAAVISLGAVGFTMQLAVTNVFNLAFASCMSASAYVAYITHSAGTVNIWLALCVAAVAGAVLAVIIERVFYRPFLRRGSNLFTVVMVSLALGLIIKYLCQAIAGPTFYSYKLAPSENLRVGGFVISERELAVVIIAVGIMLLIHLVLKYTRLGKSMRAMASNEDLARVSGVSTRRVLTLTWAVSGALAGVAGVVYAMDVVVFDPSTTDNLLLLIIAAAVVGGIGQPYGAMLGALLVGLITSIVGIWIPTWENVIAFLLLGAVILFYPQGLLGGEARKLVAVQ